MPTSNSVTPQVQNPAAGNQPLIYVGTVASLKITLTNDTGADITMTSASALEIYMPYFFSTAQVQSMIINTISQADWKFAYNSSNISLLLTYTGASGNWTAGTALTFDIENVLSTAQPGSDAIAFIFTKMNGTNIPSQLGTPLALNNSDVPDYLNLVDVLQVNLDNQGNVFVSVSSDPLTNTIYLNFKNTGKTALYDGTTMWTGTPKVTVTFEYGDTSGSLAPDQKSQSTSLGSAWGISGAIYVDQTAGWGITNPKPSGQENAPVWTLTPNPNNMQIIGISDQANVTFAFSNIISLTPPGNTQVYVQFTGFSKNPTTTYNDHLFILNIAKQQPPITRGIVNFFSITSVIPLTGPTANINIPLRWAMYYVDSIQLICNMPGVKLINTKYPGAPPVNSDLASIIIPTTFTQDTAVLFTLQSFDGQGGFLNAMQFSVFISANFFVDPRDLKVYPTVFVNNQIWMASNLDYQAPEGSVPYDNNTGNEATYGMLYTAATAQNNIPAGWRLPTQNDWDGLIKSQKNAYTDLMAGGASGFNAQLGGYGDNNNNFNNLGPTGSGYYWSSTSGPQTAGSNIYALFYSANAKVNAVNGYPSDYFLSVRYVKNS